LAGCQLFSESQNIQKKKKKITESDEIYQRAMVHPKETRESQKEFWDEGGVNRQKTIFWRTKHSRYGCTLTLHLRDGHENRRLRRRRKSSSF
jgi:hypothetical protein